MIMLPLLEAMMFNLGVLPRLLLSDPSAQGELISQTDLDTMLDEYYEARGWTREGVPTRAKLEELRLGYAADRLGL